MSRIEQIVKPHGEPWSFLEIMTAIDGIRLTEPDAQRLTRKLDRVELAAAVLMNLVALRKRFRSGRCMVCRAQTRKHCVKCQRVPYCSRACQRVDYVAHKEMCDTDSVPPAGRECFSSYVDIVRVLQGVP